MTHQTIKSDRIVMVDVDDTLVLWNLSAYPGAIRKTIEHVNGWVQVIPHHKNINTLIKFYKLGYTIVVWSGSGHAWAEAVVRALELGQYVTQIISKPLYYFDDKPCQEWMGARVWRDPKDGSEAL